MPTTTVVRGGSRRSVGVGSSSGGSGGSGSSGSSGSSSLDPALFRQVLVAAAGNFLEWYDFAVYGIFASDIGNAFFPPEDSPTTALIKTYSIFAGAFFIRPLGGIFFGHIGDTLGREVALLFTIMLMATPTLVIGLLPTYTEIGIASPLLLALMRMLQGLAAGGELPGALVYAVESAGPRHRAMMGALCQATGVGSLLASLVAAILHWILGDAAVREWGWRVPFVLGAGIAVVACFLRRNFKPTAPFLEAKAAAAASTPRRVGCCAWLASLPLAKTMRSSWRSVLRIVCASPLGMVGFYGFFVFIPSWLRHTRLFDAAFALNVAVMLLWACVVVGGGMLADRTPPTRCCTRCSGSGRPCLALHGIPLVSVLGALAVAVIAPFLFIALNAKCQSVDSAVTLAANNLTGINSSSSSSSSNSSGGGGSSGISRSLAVLGSSRSNLSNSGNSSSGGGGGGGAGVSGGEDEELLCVGYYPPEVFIPILCLGVIAHGCHVGPLQAWFVLSLKQTGSRYSSLGVAYNVGAALLGGTTPLINTALTATSVGAAGAGYYLAAAALISALALVLSERCAPILSDGGSSSGGDAQLLRMRRAAVEAALSDITDDWSADRDSGGGAPASQLGGGGGAPRSPAPVTRGVEVVDAFPDPSATSAHVL